MHPSSFLVPLLHKSRDEISFKGGGLQHHVLHFSLIIFIRGLIMHQVLGVNQVLIE
jgi:hypothetical protein